MLTGKLRAICKQCEEAFSNLLRQPKILEESMNLSSGQLAITIGIHSQEGVPDIAVHCATELRLGPLAQ